MINLLSIFILWFNYGVLIYYGIANGVYIFLLIIAAGVIVQHLLRLSYGKYQESIHSSISLPVSVLIAAYNEESNIAESLKSLLLLNYPSYEIIVINDGSTDSTLNRLIDGFNLQQIDLVYRPIIKTSAVKGFFTNPDIPNLTVVDKIHGGKSDALNVGINISRSPYFCSVDADSILEKDALLRLMRPILETSEMVKATGGIVRLINGSTVKDGAIVKVSLPKDSLSMFQIVEYIRSFLFGRTGWSAINSLLIISGTFSMFHKKTIQAIGGYSLKTVTEDMELVVNLHRYLIDNKQRYRIAFVPDPICWTEAPQTLSTLAKQRQRWHVGLAESIWRHRSMIFNPKYGRIGIFALPYQFFIELIGPAIEVVGYFVVTVSLIIGFIDMQFFMLFLTMAIAIGVFFSTGAILLEEITFKRYPKMTDICKLLLYGVLENFGYRQLNALWRVKALVKILFARRKWEYIKKHGFKSIHKNISELEKTP